MHKKMERGVEKKCCYPCNHFLSAPRLNHSTPALILFCTRSSIIEDIPGKNELHRGGLSSHLPWKRTGTVMERTRRKIFLHHFCPAITVTDLHRKYLGREGKITLSALSVPFRNHDLIRIFLSLFSRKSFILCGLYNSGPENSTLSGSACHFFVHREASISINKREAKKGAEVINV